MNLTDYIMTLIIDELENNQGTIAIARNEMADKIGCVPSQISYVISSRFTPERGYLVESRRGGGGFIRITKIEVDPDNLIMHVINTIGSSIDEASCRAIVNNLYQEKIVNETEHNIIISAISTNSLAEVPYNIRKQVRANIFKAMLLNI